MNEFVSTIIFVVGSFVAVFLAIYLSDILKQKLSAHARLALGQFARMAVQQVEQQQGEQLSGVAKKQLAIASVSILFKVYKLPIPPEEAVDIAIESAVLLLPTTSKRVEITQNE